MEPEEQPEAGSVRLNDDNEVERYDGARWQPYRQLPDDGSDNLLRGEDPDTEREAT
ncbi:hypothetical protein ACFYWX_09870 [Streptomyces sp. NPDC002888]|uniref:hypothetical protein n=1 Tax=Streptomyces sp. NPDC002888 TaxID=3364668 RepID=UPI003679D8B3